jgi:hypothetical protein
MSHVEVDQRLTEAMLALMAPDLSLQMRLTYAADALARVQADDLPDHLARMYQEIRAELLKKPVSDPRGYQPRDMSTAQATQIARQIFEVYTKFVCET